ncbi:sulfite exporter TauE/SafE family protein [Sphingomonas guangdongensis]|nr:sulfite exporter TauE/SafE family protein [Sphingomonas guangdongensis]
MAALSAMSVTTFYPAVAGAAMLGAGVLAGFAAGLFGIGGGFVVVPALFAVLPLLGAVPGELAHVAIGTSLATIVVTSARSTQAHARRGAVDFALLRAWAPWIVGGVGLGVLLAARVSGNGLATIFGTGVSLMALHFLFPLLSRRQVAETMPSGAARAGIAGGLGAFSSLLGIGGGTIAIIVMTLCGKSIHRAIATAAGIGFIIALPGMIGFMAIGRDAAGLPWGSLGYVNLPAAVVITSASILTAPVGVATAHRLSPEVLGRVFGLYLLAIGALMIRNGLNH